MLSRLVEQKFTSKLRWLNRYFYLPYQFLQVAGYRLVGQPCTYQWGQYGVEPTAKASRRGQLVAALFPIVVYFALLSLQFALAVYLAFLFYAQLPWIVVPLAGLTAFPLGLYFYLVILDWLRLRQWLKERS